jgi:cellulose synthase/poly-beta-1,6-N-acetylglucosamine synthase-like glycosyltransferase
MNEKWRHKGKIMPASLLGQIFAIVSLSAGFVFFTYAAKYYISMAVVLLSGGSTFNNFNNPNKPKSASKKEPFVSIHLPMYNEKNVADRIMKACTSLDYENYEVIVVDDSTDETFNLLKNNWSKNPQVKIIHRKTRKGFKGGALNEALKYMNPKAEYVLVFDSDFIPPPDIAKQFLWYFENSDAKNKGKPKDVEGGEIIERVEERHGKIETAAVQGYQWHMLNACENWLTRGVRVEYSGNYMVERTCQEAIGSMKMIVGSVFMIKADILKKYRWSTSLTEDWELTLRLYMNGCKVGYTPLIQAPAECPSTFLKLVRQRCRWAEGHTFNVKKYFWRVLKSPRLSGMEKFEFVSHYTLYYLQSPLFCIGIVFWFLSEWIRKGYPLFPWWAPQLGWTLLLANLFSLPLMGLGGLFLERSVKKNAAGIFSLIVISIILAFPQAYSSLKGLLEGKEGTWIRTFKTGKITEPIISLKLRKVVRDIMPRKRREQISRELL